MLGSNRGHCNFNCNEIAMKYKYFSDLACLLAAFMSFVLPPAYGLDIPFPAVQEGLDDKNAFSEMTKVKRQVPGPGTAAQPPSGTAPTPTTGTPQESWFSWATGKATDLATNALLTTGSIVYKVMDTVTLGGTSVLVEKAKDKAIDVALAAYSDGMMKKRQVQGSAADNPGTFEVQFSVDENSNKRHVEAELTVQNMIDKRQAAEPVVNERQA